MVIAEHYLGLSNSMSCLLYFNQSRLFFLEIEIITCTYIRGRFKGKADFEKNPTDSIIFVCQKYPKNFVEDDIVLDRGKGIRMKCRKKVIQKRRCEAEQIRKPI